MSEKSRTTTRGKLGADWPQMKLLLDLGVKQLKVAQMFGCSRESIRRRMSKEKAATPTGDGATTTDLERADSQSHSTSPGPRQEKKSA